MPSTSAIAVAPTAAITELRSASRTASSSKATLNQRVLYSSIGHFCVTFRLNA